ncbi:hypothetical protein F511_24829 [Dorcoceras hygrometricum]|uniref:Uncharacterized protein n=1 Tax=Dorcoceras hygrometricum TaxID=472368 RepID=A0A2Z7C7J9_9LAMI|nr:hypothetical protein F511_24829 [Dorcoceras hygrometricum]
MRQPRNRRAKRDARPRATSRKTAHNGRPAAAHNDAHHRPASKKHAVSARSKTGHLRAITSGSGASPAQHLRKVGRRHRAIKRGQRASSSRDQARPARFLVTQPNAASGLHRRARCAMLRAAAAGWAAAGDLQKFDLNLKFERFDTIWQYCIDQIRNLCSDTNVGEPRRIQITPPGITDSACKNQLVVVSVQYGPFNPYIPIRSTTIGKSRVAIDPIAMRTSWRSNSDIASVTSIGYPRMSASGESSTTMHRLLHASGYHPIPPPDDPKTNQYNQDLGLIHSTNGNHLESPNEGSSIDHQVTIYLHAQNITMFPTNETWCDNSTDHHSSVVFRHNNSAGHHLDDSIGPFRSDNSAD